MHEWEALRREYDRLNIFTCFDSTQRIWWIYMRNAVEEVVRRHNLPELQAAYDALKAFPESLPDEPVRWLALRAAVADALDHNDRTHQEQLGSGSNHL
jgi:ATP-dependent exoDNAse (exonuclease V) beta subunit